MADESTIISTFGEMGLSSPILKALSDTGYEAPTPIQIKTIPALTSGRDIMGQAQTGTGKTAAFALPLLEKIDLSSTATQGLVLVPTRELAIQVSEAFLTYSKHLGAVSVLPIYGGQPYPIQLRRLHAGAHIVVGTPGRVMDHMRRATLKLDGLKVLVLDEADEMLRMGFAEDVEWILAQTPESRQTALFTATLPPRIKSIAKNYLRDPLTVEIAHQTRTVPTIDQFYLNLADNQKLDALTQIIAYEKVEAAIVFARTKTGAADLAQKLMARGILCDALHGDMSQAQREQLIRKFKNRMVEVVVATDVAARGLDIDHISHVFNYDMPNDVEVYVHRIGRTGRAGRAGVAIMFVAPRERRMLKDIELYTKSRLKPMKLPTRADMAARTVSLFKEEVANVLAGEGIDLHLALVEQLAVESGRDMAEVAAALAKMALGDKRIDAASEEEEEISAAPVEEGMTRLFISAGRRAGVRPSDVVGALANEGGVPGKEIGSIEILERHTLVEVPLSYGESVLKKMARTTLRGKPVELKPAFPSKEGASAKAPRSERKGKPDGAPHERKKKAPFSRKKTFGKGKKTGKE